MKSGPTPWTSKISRPVLERIHAAVDGGAESPREVFDRFNVGQYGCSPRTFRRWFAVRRRSWTDRQEQRLTAGATAEGHSPSGGTQGGAETVLLDSLVDSLQVALDSKRMPDKKLPEAMSSVVQVLKLGILRDENRRRDEKQSWERDRRATQNAALDDVSKTAQLTPEQVAEIRLKVLGL